jgi:hypothetical protein
MRVPPRRLNILDGMIMVAAVSAWIVLTGLWVRELASELPSSVSAAVPWAKRTRVAGWALSALVPWTFAVLAMNLCRPRPRLWVLARQPGAVACGTAAAMLLLEAANLPLSLSTMGGLTSPLLVASWYWPTSVGSAVFVSWLILGSRGRWRVGSDGISQAGAFLGLCWIALPPSLMVIEFVLR